METFSNLCQSIIFWAPSSICKFLHGWLMKTSGKLLENNNYFKMRYSHPCVSGMKPIIHCKQVRSALFLFCDDREIQFIGGWCNKVFLTKGTNSLDIQTLQKNNFQTNSLWASIFHTIRSVLHESTNHSINLCLY